MGEEICFDSYLRSVISAYQQWWRLYTLTDATGRESKRVESDRITPAFFDFGLMVQTVEKEKVESQKEKEEEEKKEKIERLPVLDGICKYAADHVLLVGRPGSGKSTALARLLLQEAEKALSIAGAKIPVLVELRYLPSEANESSVCDRILAFMHKHDPALDIDEAGIKQLLRQGRLLLLVDGVNELPSDRGRVMVNQFRELYQKTCPMIFTTRELSAGGDLGITKRLEMQPLTEPQMQQFVMAYLPTQGERLLRQLSGRLREFGQTPLLLWMLCEVFKSDENNLVNLNLGKIFQVFTKAYVTSSIRNHQVSSLKGDIQPLSDHRLWSNAMKYLASLMMDGDSPVDFRVVIRKDEIIQKFTVLFKDEIQPAKVARDCLDDLLNYHLIQNRNADNVEFLHQLIQEYYAAEWLLGLLDNQQISYERLQHDYLNYLKWTEPLALMLALVEDKGQAVRVVRLALEVDLRLGARLSGAVKYGFQEKTVGLLGKEIDEREIPQRFVIELFGETKSDFGIKSLIQSIKNQSPFVCWLALIELGKVGSAKAVETLVEYLQDHDYDVRRKAAEELSKIGSDKAVEILAKHLKDQNYFVRSNAAEALVKIGSNKSIEILIHSLQNRDDDVRRDVALALENIRSDEAVAPLIQSLQDRDPFLRWKAAEVLGNIGSDKAIEPLIQALQDQDYELRGIAAEALGKIASSRAVEPLIQSLQDTDYVVRREAAYSLGKIGSDKAIEPLIQALQDQSDDVCNFAAFALGKIGNEKAIEPLIHALQDKSNDVIRSAAEALGNIGSDRAVQYLIQTIKNQDYEICRSSAEALGKISSDEAIEHLIQCLRDQDDNIRGNAVEVLGEIGSDKAIEPLIESLQDKADDVRGDSAKILGKIGSDKAIEPLIQSLQDRNFFVRSNAAEALGVIGSDKAVEYLIHTLMDQNENVRKSAAEALGKIGSDKAVITLIQALQDQNSFVRGSVAASLGEIGSEKSIAPLIQALQDQSSFVYIVAMNAARALGQIAGDDRNLPTLTQQLPHLLTLIPTKSSQQALSVITAIQARCKYYNYDIAQTPLQETENHANPVEKILQEIHQTLKTMSETGKYNINAEVVQIVEKNYGQVIGKNSGQVIGKNSANDPALLQTINEITQVLANLQKAHPTATEAQAKDIIEAEFKEIQNNQPNRWTTFRQQLLNPERWLNGGKATISEIAKHYAENSVFLKAGVAFLDGFSADEE